MQAKTLLSKNYTLQSPPRQILVIAMRYLGDLLLTTPLLHSIREAYPDCELDVLVFQKAADMLVGNPHINNIIKAPSHPSLADNISLIKQIFRKYDLAFVTETGDRRFYYGFLAAPVRIAFIPARNEKGQWKKLLAQGWVEDDPSNSHRVLELLRLSSLVGIPPVYSLTPPVSSVKAKDTYNTNPIAAPANYAVLHTYPQWNYKRWSVANWVATGKYLRKMGVQLVLSGGPAGDEIEYIETIHQQLPEDTINLAGQTSLAQLADIISKACLFIGPDTGTTHLAASTGIPVITIYGPTNPVRWAPWPSNYHLQSNPFQRTGSQQVNNIFLIQGEADCVPCAMEGCDRNRQSYSRCLDSLPVERVKLAIQKMITIK